MRSIEEDGGGKSQSAKRRGSACNKMVPEEAAADGLKSLLRKHLTSSQLHNEYLSPHRRTSTSQLEGPSPNNPHAFKVSFDNLQTVKAVQQHQFLTVMSVELHVRTRQDLLPDPKLDPVCAFVYSLENDIPDDCGIQKDVTGAIVVDKEQWDQTQSGCKLRTCRHNSRDCDATAAMASPTATTSTAAATGATCSKNANHAKERKECQCQKAKCCPVERMGVAEMEITYVPTEEALLQEVVRLIRRWDPDILVGYEVEMLSWGFLLERAEAVGLRMQSLLSRIPGVVSPDTGGGERDGGGGDDEHEPEVHVRGRIVLNLWRLMRHEAALMTYSFENVAYHILHQRIPLYSFGTLTRWFDMGAGAYRWRTLEHYVTRVRGSLELINRLDLIGRTSELARLFGIQFYEVLSRGSQFRVESMMLRLAKPLNFIALSPSVQQRSRMRAPECLQLIMEPESRFYSNPVVVLDFQSLYPSIMIAYNYCFSTCLGRVDSMAQSDCYEFGCSSLRVTPEELKRLRDDINISPVGVAFVKSSVRNGILPRMLEEILETRIMVKKAMKEYKGDKALRRVLDARQLGLKLIANVTYGYTAANYSGRMPCVEVGDSVVSKARETLERAIRMVNETAEWDARVVYGDTDSMFVILPGRSKEEAFRIGQEIADAVTAANPKPVKLKFEKVYLPCVLQTKKRYVGYMYETLDQKEPVFDAKGIETVRRDSCPAAVKILEKSLKLLFTNRDVSQVKQYAQRQFHKLLVGRVSLQDCTFAREYRGRATYKPGARVPALELTKRMLEHDVRAEPRVGQRVPYVIVYGSPGAPLFQLVRRPQEVLQEGLRLNAHYYINNVVIPPLERVFGLMGADVRQWFASLPRPVGVSLAPEANSSWRLRKATISQYFVNQSCRVCGSVGTDEVCAPCREDPQSAAVILIDKIRHMERTHHRVAEICRGCTSSRDVQLTCVSLDCPVFYRLAQASSDLQQAPRLKKLCDDLLEF